MVKLLIKNNANIHDLDNEAIILASDRGHLSIVKLLIKSGDDTQARDNRAIINASHKGHLSIVKLLINYNANIRVPARR